MNLHNVKCSLGHAIVLSDTSGDGSAVQLDNLQFHMAALCGIINKAYSLKPLYLIQFILICFQH